MFPVRYELGFYIPENNVRHSHRRENLKFYIIFLRLSLQEEYLFLFRISLGTALPLQEAR
jgi:hypothetical protein